MALNEQAQGILLLTAMLGRPSPDGPKPLTNGEWARFGEALHHRSLKPSDLLAGDVSALLDDWDDPKMKITAERLRRLLDRGAALAVCLEKWERAGLWVLARSDSDYPRRLRKRLGWKTPPVLFGGGERCLLSKGGIAVVGSRHASEPDLAFAAKLGKQVAQAGISIVSGGARGVDETAMRGGLDSEGTVVGVLSHGLLRATTSGKYRKSLQDGDLALVSPFNPEAGFCTGNAMARNKYIYCLSDQAVVVCCKRESGGTWEGAIENLRHGWVPVRVRQDHTADSGNAALVEKGAKCLPEDAAPPFRGIDEAASSEPADPVPPSVQAQPLSATDEARSESEQADRLDAVLDNIGHYDLFLRHLARWTADGPIDRDELAKREDVRKDQIGAWLKRAQGEEKVKETSPGQYRFFRESSANPRQKELLTE